jgi:tRNA dimethylallyltransferase
VREYLAQNGPAGSFAARPRLISCSVIGEDAATFKSPASRVFSAVGRDSLPAPRSVSAAAVVEPVSSSALDSGGAKDPLLVVIVGPTAAGKSALALELAGRLAGEVVNYDSVQLYRGFDIGAGKLMPGERRGIPHHLLDIVGANQIFTAGDFVREATRVLNSLRERNKLPILAGGTGLYLRALIQGLSDGPARSEALRGRLSRLAARRGREFLHRMLKRLDPDSAMRIQPRDTQKIIRALEVRFLTGRPISAVHASGRKGLRGFRPLTIGLDPERGELHRRINARVERMFQTGLVEETQAALERSSLDPDAASRLTPFGALGYRQVCELLAGRMSREEAILTTQTATRQYAKRQMTWFRREAGVKWFAGLGDDPQVQQSVLEWVKGVMRTECAAGGHEYSPR